MSYATTGADVVMWNALPRPVPWVAASIALIAAVTPVGQFRFRPGSGSPGSVFRKRIATWPAGIWGPVIGAYLMFCPVPEGMNANIEGSSVMPPKSTWTVTGVVHVLA